MTLTSEKENFCVELLALGVESVMTYYLVEADIAAVQGWVAGIAARGWSAGMTAHWCLLDGKSGVRCRHDRPLVLAGWLVRIKVQA